MPDLLSVLPQFGLAGFAIFIMWKMFEANCKERERHENTAKLEREKFMSKINEDTKTHNQFQERVRNEIMKQLNENTTAFRTVMNHFNASN